MRVAPAILLLIPCLVSAQEDDPRTLAFKRYRAESLKHILRSREAQSEELVVALRGIERHDCPAAAEFLMQEMLAGRPEGDVQREAVRMLAKFKSPESVEAMANIWESKLGKNDRARILSLFAFGGKRADASRRVLGAALGSKDARLVAAACRSLAEGDDDHFKAEMIEKLRDGEPLIRAWAARSLAELAEFDVKPMVFELFCTDKSNFVRYMAWAALRKIEKDNRLPCDTAEWKLWWERNHAKNPEVWGKRFPGRKEVKAANWFGIPVLADRVVFVLDATQRMDQGWRIDPLKEREKPPEKRTPNFFSVKTRYSLGTAYVGQALEQLPDKTQFALTLYHDRAAPPNHSVYPDSGKWLKLSDRTRERAMEHLGDVKPGGTSSLYEGLKAAWEFQADRRPVERGAQVICFLTNGTPRGGEFKDRPDRVEGEVWAAARERGIVVHTVGVHFHAYALLKNMAKQTGGYYVHAQQEGDTTEPQDLEFWPDKKAAFEKARKKK